jgi:hypothetical protein
MFYFILHPLQWLIPEHAKIIFKCERIGADFYQVSWTENDKVSDDYFGTGEVTEALAKGWWIMTDAQGEY